VALSARSRVLVLILIIIAAATAIRIVDLGELPPGLFVDEAFTGYDAYSLSRTARDMWGNRLPIFFMSWGDYNSGLYRYLTVPWVATMGLTEAAVRAAAALAGVLTILVAFALGRRLFSTRVGLVAAALLAVSPWHLQFSRIGFRGILLPLFLSLGVLLFDVAIERKRWWPILAAVVFGVALYTYSPARVIVPVMFVVLFLLYRSRMEWSRRNAVAMFAVLFVLSVPLIATTLGGEGQQRYAIMSVFNPETGGGVDAASTASLIVRNYVSHFSARFLLTAGDANLRHSPAGIGQLNWGTFALLLTGLVFAARQRSRSYLLLIIWMLVAPLPDSFTTDNVPNALRSIAMLPAVQILAAAGMFGLLDLKTAPEGRWRLARPAIVALAILLVGISAGRSLTSYFTAYRVESAPWWDCGYREAISYTESVKGRFDGAIVVRPDREHMHAYAMNPYVFIYPLFYTAHDPARLHRSRDAGSYVPLDPPGQGLITVEMLTPGTMYIIRAHQTNIDHPLHTVLYPSGEPAFVVVGEPVVAGGQASR